MNDYTIEQRKIRLTEYQSIRKTTGWSTLDNELVRVALKNDLFSVCILDKRKTIGIGRVIGDGAIYYYIQDVIVHPQYQDKGIGKMIMKSIENYLVQAASDNAFIGLMAAEGVKNFYKKFGYRERPQEKPGMYKIVSNNRKP